MQFARFAAVWAIGTTLHYAIFILLAAGLDLYNMGWGIAQSKELSQRVAELPQARLLAQQGNIPPFNQITNAPVHFRIHLNRR